jgi:hypothetical protein
MGLDILTERGKEMRAHEMRAAQIVEAQWWGCRYLFTGITAVVDAVIMKDWCVSAVAETKSRPSMTLDQLRGAFRNEWLVTHSKVIGGARVADGLVVPYWGLLHLVPDDIVMRVKLYEPETGWLVPIRVANTKTKRTCNGGEAWRDNAFIDMSSADILRDLTDDTTASNTLPLREAGTHR